jgi:hypothetical protein
LYPLGEFDHDLKAKIGFHQKVCFADDGDLKWRGFERPREMIGGG